MFQRVAVLALVLAPLLPGAGRAQVTTAGAHELVQRLDAYLQPFTGSDHAAEELGLMVLPQGDHYAAFLPLGSGHDAPVASALIRQPLGQLLLDEIRLPALSSFADAHDKFEISIGEQDGQYLIEDPAATARMGHLGMGAIGIDINSTDDGQMLAQVGRILLSTTMQPRLDDRADFVLDKRVENVAVSLDGARTLPDFKFRMGALRSFVSLDGMRGDRLSPLLQAVSGPRAGDAAQALADFVNGITLGISLDNVHFTNDRTDVAFAHNQIALTASQRDGMLGLDLVYDTQGMHESGAALGPRAGFIPERFATHQSLRNVPVAALIHLASLIDRHAEPTQADIQPLFAGGGIRVAVDSLDVDVGGSQFSATGAFTCTSLRDCNGNATVTATNLDAMQQKIAADPVLAPGVSALIFLKGVARVDGNRMIWDIDIHDRRLTVNKQDFTALLQSATGGGPPRTAPRRP